MCPLTPVKRASVRAGSSSPAPPVPPSGVAFPSPSSGSVSVSGSEVVVSVSGCASVVVSVVGAGWASDPAGGLVLVVAAARGKADRESRSTRGAKKHLRMERIDTIMEFYDREAMDTR